MKKRIVILILTCVLGLSLTGCTSVSEKVDSMFDGFGEKLLSPYQEQLTGLTDELNQYVDSIRLRFPDYTDDELELLMDFLIKDASGEAQPSAQELIEALKLYKQTHNDWPYAHDTAPTVTAAPTGIVDDKPSEDVTFYTGQDPSRTEIAPIGSEDNPGGIDK